MENQEHLDKHEDHALLSRSTKLSFGSAGFGQSIIEDVVNNYIFLFYNTILLVPATWVANAFLVTRFWDAISDPMMGHISDNTRSRWGRRRPYILVGGILTAIVFFAMCAPPAGLTTDGYFYYLAGIALLYFTCYTVLMVPLGGLGAELTMDYHERTRLNSYRGFLNRAGAIFAASCWYIAGLFGDYRTGFMIVGAVFGLLAILAFVTCVRGTSEDAELQRQPRIAFWKGFKTTLSNGPFWMLAGIVFCVLMGILLGLSAGNYLLIHYLFGGDNAAAGWLILVNGLVFNFTALASVPLLSWLGVRIGKEWVMFLGTFMFLLSPLLSWVLFNPSYPYLELLFQIPLALGLTIVMIYSQAMMADLVDLDEVVTFRRREGSYASVLSFLAKMAPPMGLWGFAQLLEHWARFEEGAAVQSPETIHRLRLILILAPLIPFGIACLLALLYPIRERRIREVRALLEQRRAQTRQSAVADNA